MVTLPVIDNSADTITLNRDNVVLFRQLFKQFKNEKMLNIEFCMMHLRIHLIPTNEVAKILTCVLYFICVLEPHSGHSICLYRNDITIQACASVPTTQYLLLW